MDAPLTAPSSLTDTALRGLALRRGYRLKKKRGQDKWTAVDASDFANVLVPETTKYDMERQLRMLTPHPRAVHSQPDA